MNKNLNNWMDVVEGLPEGTTNAAIEKERDRQGHKKDDAENFLKDHIIVGKIKK